MALTSLTSHTMYMHAKIGLSQVPFSPFATLMPGLSLHTFHGNFFVRSTDLLSLPLVNPEHAYTINIAIDESLKDLDVVCFQAALLYTSSKG